MWINIALWVVAYLNRFLNTHQPVTPHHNDVESVVVEVTRMRPDVLERLERECAPPYVSPATTDIMAGYMLGVQAVLQKLRNGYAVD